MKLVRYYCDTCGKRMPKRNHLTTRDRQRLVVDMLTHGYGMQDGHHWHKLAICSAQCGIIALDAIIQSIKGADVPVPGTKEWRAGLTGSTPRE